MACLVELPAYEKPSVNLTVTIDFTNMRTAPNNSSFSFFSLPFLMFSVFSLSLFLAQPDDLTRQNREDSCSLSGIPGYNPSSNPKTCQTCRFSSLTLNQLNQKLWAGVDVGAWGGGGEAGRQGVMEPQSMF